MGMKKYLKIIPVTIMMCSLAACSFFPFDKIVTNQDYLYSENGVSDTYSNAKVDANKKKLKYTLTDLYNNYLYDVDKIPSEGDVNLLVVPVWFTDSSQFISTTYKESVRQDIFDAFFGNESTTGWRSVAGYYKQESFNQLNLQGTVTKWWECGKKSTALTSNTETVSLVDKAVEWYKQNNNDISAYDADKDGYIDGVVLIYASPDYTQDSRYESNMWAYTYWTQENNPNVYSPNANAFLWASFDFMYDSDTYKYGKRYGYGDTSHCNLDTHTYIHEFGHLIGLQDYYDYALSESTSASNVGYEAAAGFSMQDYNVGGHDPYSKLLLGWNNPYVVTDSCTITIGPNQTTGDVILLTNNFSNSPFDEYFLLELYTPTGLNAFDVNYPYYSNEKMRAPTLSGIRLWHVDSRVATPINYSNGFTWSENKVGTNPTLSTRYGYSIITTNTSKTKDTEGYSTGLNSFTNYRTLQLIRRGKNNYRCGDYLSNSDLFVTGSTFDMTTYANAFANNGTLNNGTALNFSISFDSISSTSATITFTKLSN